MSTDNVTPGGSHAATGRASNSLRAIRKVGKHGNSLMLCIPTGFVYTMKLNRGDLFITELDGDHKGFHVRIYARVSSGLRPEASSHE